LGKAEVEIKIKDIPLWKDVIDLIGKMLKDERLDFVVREEYATKFEQLMKE